MNLIDEIYGPSAFEREDEADDRAFYRADRFVSHLDRRALSAVEVLAGQLIVEQSPAVLDLTGRLVHDLNADPRLGFDDASFDVVMNVVSVDYLTRPFEVFAEVGRVLRPGGLFLVVFSKRMFPEKAVRVWREADEKGRLIIVEDYFRESGAFEAPRTFVWKGRPRPADDPHVAETAVCDPIYALFAERKAGDPSRPPRPEPRVEWPRPWGPEEVARRTACARETLACPHCGEALLAWEAPDGPFAEWEEGLYHICFNDACPFLIDSYDAMARQGNLGYTCRVLYDQTRDRFRPVPVNRLSALRSGIRKPVANTQPG